MIKRLYRFTILVLLVASLPVQAGDIYRCIDTDGSHHFQDTPCHAQAKPYKRWIDRPKPESDQKSIATPADPVVVNLWAGESRRAIATDAEESPSFMWRATRKGSGTVFLMGSIHFGRPEMYPLSQRVQSAFEQSDLLMVELNALAANPLVMGQLMSEYGMYQNGDELRNHVTNQTWHRLQKAVEHLNIPVSLVNSQKPWMAAMTLSALSVKQSGYSEALGIDMHFLKRAQGRKKIIELEGVEFQASLMANLSKKSQLAMLEDTLRIMEQGDEYFGLMFDVWQKGDAAGMAALIQQSVAGKEGAKELMKRLLDDRNIRMLDSLQRESKVGQTSFVVVGAAHLVGPKGLVALLAQKGFVLEQY